MQKNKANVLIGTAWMLCISAPSAADTACDVCGVPTVAIYDVDARGLQPRFDADAHTLADYINLNTAAYGCDAAATLEATHDCVRRLSFEYQPKNAADVDASSFRPALALRPPLEADLTDYFIEGSIKGQRGDYVLELSLKDSTSGAVVSSGLAHFASPDEAQSAGRKVESTLGPLLSAIRTYQKKLRDASKDQSAIKARFEVVPDKAQLRTGESTAVTVKLLDCDGTPLKSRTFALNMVSGPGTISPQILKTDEHGVASTRFTAGAEVGVAVFRPYYLYTNVSHVKLYAERGDTFIDVGMAPLRGGSPAARKAIWELRLHVTQDVWTRRFHYIRTPQPSHQWASTTNEAEGSESVDFQVQAWFEGPASMQSEAGRYYATGNPVAIAASGSRFKRLWSFDEFNDPGSLHTILNTTNASGDLRSKNLSDIGLKIREGRLALQIEGQFDAEIQTDYTDVWPRSAAPIEPRQASTHVQDQLEFLFNSDMAGATAQLTPAQLASNSIPIHMHVQRAQGDGTDEPRETSVVDINGTLTKVNER